MSRLLKQGPYAPVSVEDHYLAHADAQQEADDLDRILAFGDLIDFDNLTSFYDQTALRTAERRGYVVLANPSNPTPLYKLTESGRRFLSEYATAGKPKQAEDDGHGFCLGWYPGFAEDDDDDGPRA